MAPRQPATPTLSPNCLSGRPERPRSTKWVNRAPASLALPRHNHDGRHGPRAGRHRGRSAVSHRSTPTKAAVAAAGILERPPGRTMHHRRPAGAGSAPVAHEPGRSAPGPSHAVQPSARPPGEPRLSRAVAPRPKPSRHRASRAVQAPHCCTSSPGAGAYHSPQLTHRRRARGRGADLRRRGRGRSSAGSTTGAGAAGACRPSCSCTSVTGPPGPAAGPTLRAWLIAGPHTASALQGPSVHAAACCSGPACAR